MIDPASAAPFAYALYDIRNARDIQHGHKPAERLGVRALDDLTFEVELEQPAPLFLKLTGSIALACVPRQAVEAAKRAGSEAAWVQPENIVSSGAFRLKEWRPYERVILERNPAYYDATWSRWMKSTSSPWPSPARLSTSTRRTKFTACRASDSPAVRVHAGRKTRLLQRRRLSSGSGG